MASTGSASPGKPATQKPAAPRHTADEEVSLFPRLEAASHAEAAHARATIARLDADHRSAEARHRVVDEIGQSWLREGRLEREQLDELRDQLERLDALYREHIPVEDGELFPAAARILTAADLESVGREMADRRGVKFKTEVGQA